ncbi:MAG: malonyl-ACP O-methyltransferase BioC [Zoogloeaceae bacterium]|jgi:malonyl-CoA O-methyltransferase|nr:malonyl-ACP O-methyltransferase BioC [Zoogloeaceae bacterium]
MSFNINLLPSKKQVRRSFEKAAPSYDTVAKVQRWTAARLVGGLPETFAPAVILDAGCGTGFAQEMLAARFPAARCIALDFSAAMLSRITRPEFSLAGDVERLPLKSGIVGLYWSNFTAQWCNLDALLKEAQRVLWPNGRLALSMPGTNTFRELAEAFAQVDAYRHTLNFTTQEGLHTALARTGFSDPRFLTETCVLHYKDLKTLLHTIKSAGANQFASGERSHGLMGKSAWQKLEAAYEARRTPQGLPLTYEVMLCHARKPG